MNEGGDDKRKVEGGGSEGVLLVNLSGAVISEENLEKWSRERRKEKDKTGLRRGSTSVRGGGESIE